MHVITLEDHFSTGANVANLPPEADSAAPYVRGTWTQQRSQHVGHNIAEALFDMGAGRIAAMDAAGIDQQVLSITTPGAQIADADAALAVARDANDRIRAAMTAYPDRFLGFATVPTPMPDAGVAEFARAIDELGFQGAMITGHTNGLFLDDRRFWPLFEAAQDRDVPIYIHPGTPHPLAMQSYFNGYEDLARPAWGFAVDASIHFLRILFSGAFDSFPRLRIILGHLGEGLPFGLHRLNDHTLSPARNRKLKREPINYVRDNLVVTTSGNFCNASLECTIAMLGIDNVMFSVDWPYESNVVAAAFLAQVRLSDSDKEKLAYRNAQRVLRLA